MKQAGKPLEWLTGGGAMSELIASKDWSRTPLGPIESWPSNLRTTVSLCLSSNFPINILWGPDAIQIYNDGYRVLCGESHPRALGEPYSVTWASAWPTIGEPYERARRGETSYLENQRMFLFRNGYLEETFFTFSLSPIRDEAGRVAGLFHPVTETTTSMLAQRRTHALRAIADTTSEARTLKEAFLLAARTLSGFPFDLPFIALYSVDEAGNQTRLEGMSGLPADSLAASTSGWPFHEAWQTRRKVEIPDFAARFGTHPCLPNPEPLQKAFVLPIGGKSLGQPLGFLALGVSTRLPFDESYSTFFDMVGDAVSVAVERVRAYERERKRAEALAELDQAKTAFFSNISHEFRTPLTLMLGPMEDALAGKARSLQGETLEAVYRNSVRLLKLVNVLLDFSRIEAGRMQARFEPVNLAELTQDLASNFRSATERAGIQFTVLTEQFSEPAFVDPEMWEKIVLNLLSNALKFTFEGRIRLILRQTGHQAELVVRDTGTGIPANELPNLFKRFHRIQGARARSHEGSGIGLALVSELIQLHGGTIKAESVLNEGTTFTLRFPLGKAHLEASQVRLRESSSPLARRVSGFVSEAIAWAGTDESPVLTSEPSAGRPDRKTRILVADDNPDMREYIRKLLEPHWQVQVVNDGLRALEEAKRDSPDLIVSDIMMPRMNGFELLERIRADESTQRIPVILLSARAGGEATIEGLGAGADDYLAKPFSAKELLARVETHLKLSRLRQDFEIEHQALMARDEFLSVASHELQTPITSLKLQLQMILKEARRGTTAPLSSPDVTRKLENVHRQVDRVVSLIDLLLDVARAREGTLALELQEVELLPWVRSVVDSFSQTKPEQEIRIQSPAGFAPRIVCDPTRVEQILISLLSNAAKYGSGKPIVVEFAGDAGRVQISVKDLGVGIPKHEQQRLFKRFEQDRNSRLVGGLGLGLYISQQIAQAHGGEIKVGSVPGMGSVFTLELPLRAAASPSVGIRSELPRRAK